MSIRDEIETFNAALKRFEQALVTKFKTDPAEAAAVTEVAENVSDHPLVKDAISLARDKALSDADAAASADDDITEEPQKP